MALGATADPKRGRDALNTRPLCHINYHSDTAGDDNPWQKLPAPLRTLSETMSGRLEVTSNRLDDRPQLKSATRPTLTPSRPSSSVSGAPRWPAVICPLLLVPCVSEQVFLTFHANEDRDNFEDFKACIARSCPWSVFLYSVSRYKPVSVWRLNPRRARQPAMSRLPEIGVSTTGIETRSAGRSSTPRGTHPAGGLPIWYVGTGSKHIVEPAADLQHRWFQN